MILEYLLETTREELQSGTYNLNINVDAIERMETNVIQASSMMAKVEDDLKGLGRSVSTSTGTLLRHLQIFKGI